MRPNLVQSHEATCMPFSNVRWIWSPCFSETNSHEFICTHTHTHTHTHIYIYIYIYLYMYLCEKEWNKSDRVYVKKGNKQKIYIGVVLMISYFFVCFVYFYANTFWL